mmetsp:Transcript_41894/g.99419  ORF Transcript_41894/g.99419 Transcript_41894/m.99419 type:complete len:239 (-) Transcript_41894:819-1535(-)
MGSPSSVSEAPDSEFCGLAEGVGLDLPEAPAEAAARGSSPCSRRRISAKGQKRNQRTVSSAAGACRHELRGLNSTHSPLSELPELAIGGSLPTATAASTSARVRTPLSAVLQSDAAIASIRAARSMSSLARKSPTATAPQDTGHEKCPARLMQTCSRTAARLHWQGSDTSGTMRSSSIFSREPLGPSPCARYPTMLLSERCRCSSLCMASSSLAISSLGSGTPWISRAPTALRCCSSV